MASVEVESAANTLAENLERTPEVPKEAEPVVAAPLAVEELKEETTIDAPPPVEEPPTVEADTKVVGETKSEVGEPKAETTQETEKVKAAEEETLAVPEEPQVTKEAGSQDNPETDEAKESVKEEKKPAELAATTDEVTTEK